MFRRHTATFVIGALLVAVTASAAPARRGNINARQRRQAERIKDGKADGQLTKGELDRLHADEAAIRAEERVYRRTGGGLNPAERRDLERDLNRTSREIYRDRHNRRVPN